MNTPPIRPERPAFTCLDPDSDEFDDSQHIAFYPAEREEGCITSVTELVPPPSGIVSRNPYRVSSELSDIPSSVRSFSRDIISLNNQQEHSISDVHTSGILSHSREASPSPSDTSTQWAPLSRSRSPLACPPSYPLSPTETMIGSADPLKQSFLNKLSRRGRFKSTALLDIDSNPLYKPWANKKDFLSYVSYWLTWSMILFMGGASALALLVNMSKMEKLGNLCLVLDDDFDNGLDRNIWFHEVDMGGFGNGEFEMMTSSENNSFVEDGILYLVPTLTSDVIGKQAVFDGYTYNVQGCTNANLTHCSAVSNTTLSHVINPVQSARLTTKYSQSIQYGKVEIRARMPRGDWIWPAIWMLPLDDEYGPWPVSGEIDIIESRGNDVDYPFQGRDYVRTSLNWGPADFLNSVAKTFGWFTVRRQDFTTDFHTYVLEWSDKYLRSYVDTPLHTMFSIKFDRTMFELGDYPPTAHNGSVEVAIKNPWAKSESNAAPFDKPFYLLMNVAVGGRNGWFPDTLGGKMWFDQSDNAMYDFARAQEVWYKTWPEDPKRRGMAIDYVKMWQQC